MNTRSRTNRKESCQSSVKKGMPRHTTSSMMKKKLSNRKKKSETMAAVTTVSESFACKLTYDVLNIIFKNLNVKDLGNAAKVCRLWSEVAAIEKNIRTRFVSMLLYDYKMSWEDIYPEKELTDYLNFKPMLHLTFIAGDYHYGFYDDDGDDDQNDSNCPCNWLPQSCDNIIIENYGVIKDEIELEEVEDKAACLILPEEPGVTIQTIYPRSPWRCGFRMKGHDDEILKKMALTENVKCIIILKNSNSGIPLDELEHNIVDLLPPRDNLSVAGGIMNGLKICEQQKSGRWCSDEKGWAAILISGPSVESWSVVMTKSYDTKEKVEAKLTVLKDKVKLKKHSVAFMFACEERGKSMFQKENVESTIFKKVFPDVPLIGTVGNGEFGHCQIEPMKERTLQYSTVFMIVTYGEL